MRRKNKKAKTDPVRLGAEQVMSQLWQTEGYTWSDVETQHQSLWDSCFHAIIWAALGDKNRAKSELQTLLNSMSNSGFVPHISFPNGNAPTGDPWGPAGQSSITQPPMYGHAIAELVRRGVKVPEQLSERAAQGLRFFQEHRLDDRTGLIRLVHPWEAGIDSSPRWDGFYTAPVATQRWDEQSEGLLRLIVHDMEANPVSNKYFDVLCPSFTALVAFNIRELASVSKVMHIDEAAGLITAVERSWNNCTQTWENQSQNSTDNSAATLEAALCVLVDKHKTRRHIIGTQILDSSVFGGQYGATSVSRYYPSFNPDISCRGAVYPPLLYLLWVAFTRGNDELDVEVANLLAAHLQRGAVTSGWAEFWHPETGRGCGNIPHTRAALACAVAY